MVECFVFNLQLIYLNKGILVVVSIVYLKLFYIEDIVLLVAFLFYIRYLTLGSSFYIIAEPIEILFDYF